MESFSRCEKAPIQIKNKRNLQMNFTEKFFFRDFRVTREYSEILYSADIYINVFIFYKNI